MVFFIRKLRSSCERPLSSLLDLCPMLLLLLELPTNLHKVSQCPKKGATRAFYYILNECLNMVSRYNKRPKFPVCVVTVSSRRFIDLTPLVVMLLLLLLLWACCCGGVGELCSIQARLGTETDRGHSAGTGPAEPHTWPVRTTGHCYF